jgi:hypothetical protein
VDTTHFLTQIPADIALQIADKAISLADKIGHLIWRREAIDFPVGAGSFVRYESLRLGCG